MKHLGAKPNGRWPAWPLLARLARFSVGRWFLLWLGLVGVCQAQTILAPPANQSALVGSSVTFNVSATNSAIYTDGFNYGALDGWPHTNVFYTGRTAGTLNFSYLFGSLNDRLTVYYGTNQIYDTGYIGGPNTRTYTTNYGPGTATSVTVIINEGNYDNHGSKWEYHLSMLAPIYYQWQFNSANIAGATNAAYTVNNITTLNAGTYRVVVADNFGPATNAAGTLTVLVPPSITQPPTNLTVLAGASANFTVAATGDPPLRTNGGFLGRISVARLLTAIHSRTFKPRMRAITPWSSPMLPAASPVRWPA